LTIVINELNIWEISNFSKMFNYTTVRNGVLTYILLRADFTLGV